MTLRSPVITRYAPIYRHAALVGTIGMALTLFPLPKPNYQTDWPNPRAPNRLSSDELGFIDPTEIWLIGKDQFFGPPGMGPDYDWPNPRGPRGLTGDELGFIDPTEIWLIGQDKFFGPPGMGPDYDWPNPRGTKGLLFDQASRNYNLSTITFSPFYLTDWQNPRGAKGLAADQLGVVDASEFWLFNSVYPFSQIDWANPRAAKGLLVDLVDASEFWLFNSVYPFSQIDWPNPRGRQPIVVDYVTSSKIWLAGQDQFFGPAGKGPSYDWPNPQGQRQRNEYGFVDPYKVLLFATPLSPFYLLDWPNPNRSKSNLQDFGKTISLELIGQDQFFGPPGLGPTYDWSNPQRPRQRNEYGSVDNYKILLFAAPPSPFYVTDWQNPRAAKGLSGDQLGYTDPTEFWMLNSLYPFSQIDWTNPQRLRPIGFDQASYNVNLLSVVFAPFNQIDWPNPARIRVPTSDQIAYNLNLLVTFAPFYQLDWPNPSRTKIFTVDQFGYNLNQFVTFAPFYQLDWPIPKGQQPSISLKTFSGFNYYTIGQDQFFGPPGFGPTYDWPNPQLPRQRNEFGFIDRYKIAIIAGVPVPHNLFDWPVPKGAKGLTADQLGFVDRLKLLNYNIHFERVATTAFENRVVYVNFENRMSTASIEKVKVAASIENRTATTVVENRIATAPEDKE